MVGSGYMASSIEAVFESGIAVHAVKGNVAGMKVSQDDVVDDLVFGILVITMGTLMSLGVHL